MTQQYMWVVQAKWTRHNHHWLWLSWVWTQKTSKQVSTEMKAQWKTHPPLYWQNENWRCRGGASMGEEDFPRFSLKWCSSWKSYISKCTRPICWFHHRRINYVLSSLIKTWFFLNQKKKRRKKKQLLKH